MRRDRSYAISRNSDEGIWPEKKGIRRRTRAEEVSRGRESARTRKERGSRKSIDGYRSRLGQSPGRHVSEVELRKCVGFWFRRVLRVEEDDEEFTRKPPKAFRCVEKRQRRSV